MGSIVHLAARYLLNRPLELVRRWFVGLGDSADAVENFTRRLGVAKEEFDRSLRVQAAAAVLSVGAF